MTTDDLRIARSRPLLAPAVLFEDLPLPAAAEKQITASRVAVSSIIHGRDRRLLAVVGPCSIHDPVSALDYARRLAPVARRLQDRILVIMRVYFEKPRTVMGWKGLINDPDLDGSFQINKGLHMGRKLLLDIAETGLPAATEFLDTTFGQYYADLIAWGAIGARTVESQVHRELASGLSMPVGFKNRTDGNIKVAIDAMRAAAQPHWFPSLTKEGAPAILETRGNLDTHLVLRGGDDSGPNFKPRQVEQAAGMLAGFNLPEGVMVDCSHANSGKDPQRQLDVLDALAGQVSQGRIRGFMLESHLRAGRQDLSAGAGLVYGRSITDACLDLERTITALEKISEAVGP